MLRIVRRIVFATVVLMVVGAAPALAQVREVTGQTPGGAWYRIAVPAAWRAGGPVVLFEHGLDFSAPTDAPSLGPLKDVMLAEGYAIAASSYRQRGWALFTAMEDNRELLAVFQREFGAIGEVVPFGGSMGGLVALRVAEQADFPPVKGVYALCPAAAGSRIWDAAVDLRLAFDAICSGAGAEQLPVGDPPLPWVFDLDDIPPDLGDLLDQLRVANALVALNRCTGINLPPDLRNDAMRERLRRLMNFAHVDNERFFILNIGYAMFVMSDLIRALDKLRGENPFTTAWIDYGSADLNAQIRRVIANPESQALLRETSDFRGRIGSAKVLSMHTSGDQLVIPGNQDFLGAVIPPDQLTVAIVREETPSHCGFTPAEGIAGWEALRRWKDGGAQPKVTDLQTGCGELVGRGIEGPCRFDATAKITPFDDVVRPRSGSIPTPVPLHAPRAMPADVAVSRIRR